MAKTVLLQRNNSLNINEEVNIVLSPELYSVRIFDIPIESTKELKLVIPDFFEDFFDIQGYSFYHIKQSKHKYMCFAYKQEEILSIIKKANLELKYVKNIYFLQNELDKFNNTLYEYNENKYICSDNIIVPMPKNINIDFEAESIDIQNIKLSKHNIFLNKSSKYIDNTTAYIISFVFIIFAVFNFYKINDITKQISQNEESFEKLKKTYKIPNSIIQTKSIINEYKEIQNNYSDFLNAFEYVLKYRNNVNILLNNIEYKNNKLIVELENKNKSQIEKYIKRKYKILSSRVFDNRVIIEVKI